MQVHFFRFSLLATTSFSSRRRGFREGRIEQILEDLSNPTIFAKHRSLFESAELIFCDAPKDGVFEPRFFANLTTVKPTSNCLLVLDDTPLLNMIDVWRAIRSPKLDLTSFGYWSGTGLIDVTNGLKFQMWPPWQSQPDRRNAGSRVLIHLKPF